MKLKKVLLGSALAASLFAAIPQSVSAASTYWSKYGNTWYLYEDGSLVTNRWHKDSSNKWYWLNSNGEMATGWKKVNGSWYFFDSSGAMKTGWVFTGGNWYYMSNSGEMKTGWVSYNGNWYYMNGSGEMQHGVIQDSSYNYYALKDSGEMKTGTFVVQGLVKSTNSSGVITNSTGLTASNGYASNFVKNALNRSLYESETTGSEQDVNLLYAKMNMSEINKEFLKILNAERASRGLSPMKYDETLANGAEIRSRELADQKSIHFNGVAHTRAGSTYKKWETIYNEELSYLGFPIQQYGRGENIAVNIARQNSRNGYKLSYSNPREIAQLAFDVWKESPNHYKLMMLNESNVYAGLGVGVSSYYYNHTSNEYEYINAIFTTLHVVSR